MALGTMAGADVLRAEVSLPRRGPWSAEVRTATETVPSGAVTLAFSGGLSLAGTVRRASNDGKGAVSALVVGGADGLRAEVSGHYRNGFARDVLGAILRAAGETQATDIASDVLAAQWGSYSLSGRCASALDSLAAAVGQSLGSAVTWRVRAAGDVWMGVEAWDAATLGRTDAVLEQHPSLALSIIGTETPSLYPGVALSGVGNVEKVVHVIRPDYVRSLVYTA